MSAARGQIARGIARLVLAALMGLLAPVALMAAPGDLDTSFGDGGKVMTDFGAAEVAAAMALQPDGKLIVAGRTTANANIALGRYNANGSLDAQFGSGGLVITDFGTTDQAFGVVVRSDGKIVIAGRRANDAVVARYNADGTADPSFGAGGRVLTNFGATELALALAIQPDNKLVIAGRTTSGGNFSFALARYQPDGALDANFGQNGLVITDFGGTADRIFALALQPDGKIVVAGDSDANVALARYNANGTLDASFGGGGKVITTFGGRDQASAIALQPDGKIVVAGQTDVSTNLDVAVARYNSDGSLDDSFGSGGRVITDFNAGIDDSASAVALQFDGKIVVAGGSGGDFVVARYNPNGALDTSFGKGGKSLTDFGGEDRINALVLQPDGAIAVAGEGNGQFALARYQAFLPASLTLIPSSPLLVPGEGYHFDLTMANQGLSRPVDVYFGFVPPAGSGAAFNCASGDGIVFYGPGFVPAPICFSAMSTSTAARLTNVLLPSGLEFTLVPNVYSAIWPADQPPGLYLFFVAFASVGTLDPIAIGTVELSLIP